MYRHAAAAAAGVAAVFIALGVAGFAPSAESSGRSRTPCRRARSSSSFSISRCCFWAARLSHLTALPNVAPDRGAVSSRRLICRADLQGLLRGAKRCCDNLAARRGAALTGAVATFLAFKLFRWEKEEKMRPSAKLWLLAVLAPFFVDGRWQAHAQDNLAEGRRSDREMRAQPHCSDPRCAPVPGRWHR